MKIVTTGRRPNEVLNLENSFLVPAGVHDSYDLLVDVLFDFKESGLLCPMRSGY